LCSNLDEDEKARQTLSGVTAAERMYKILPMTEKTVKI